MDELLSIGEMAKRNNVSIQRLRYYDNIGLFSPTKINKQSNYRYYTSAQSAQLAIIQQLQYIGFSLQEIKLFFKHPSLTDFKTHLSSKMDQLIQQEERLQRKKDLLKNFQHTINANDSTIHKTCFHTFEALFINDIVQDLTNAFIRKHPFSTTKIIEEFEKLNISKAYLPHFYVNHNNFNTASVFIRSIHTLQNCNSITIEESDYLYCYSDENNLFSDCKRLQEHSHPKSCEFFISPLPKIDETKNQNYLIYLKLVK